MTPGRLKIWNLNADVWQYTPGGGSQPFKDLGTVTAAELIADGPKTLYTPQAGEFVCVFFAASVDLDNTWNILLEPYSTLALNAGIGVSVEFGEDASNSQDLFFIAGGNDTVSGLFFPGSDVKALLGQAADPTSELLAMTTWQSLHAFNLGDAIVDGGNHVQRVIVAGTSGASEPTWPDDGFSQTSDGGVTWVDMGEPPTTGSLHVVALTGVPVAP